MDDLKNVPIGISQATVIEYMADRVLEHAGISKEEIAKIAVPKISDRTALLASGELKVAVMPDPLASLLMQQGAILFIDDTSLPEVSNSVYSFRTEFLEERPADAKALMEAIEKAVNDINSDKDAWKNLMVELKLVPEAIVGDYQVPTFPTASVPSESQFNDAVKWALDRGLIPAAQNYMVTIDDSFLP